MTSRSQKQNERRSKRHPEDPDRETKLARRRARYHLHKDAINERVRCRYATDPEFRLKRKKDPVKARGAELKIRYGVSLEDYATLLARQFGVCAICLRQLAQRLCVDHCHASGKIRGLICRACNCALGLLRDDANVAIAAAAYLRKTSA